MLCMVTVTLFSKHSELKSEKIFYLLLLFLWNHFHEDFCEIDFTKFFGFFFIGEALACIKNSLCIIIFSFSSSLCKRPARDLKPWIYVPVQWNSKHSWIQALQKYRLTSTIAKLYIHQFNSDSKKRFYQEKFLPKKIDNHLPSGQSKL